MAKINIINLVNKPFDISHFTHATEKKRAVLKQIKNGKATHCNCGSHDKLPGGFADFKKFVKVKRLRMPRHCKVRRNNLKNVV